MESVLLLHFGSMATSSRQLDPCCLCVRRSHNQGRRLVRPPENPKITGGRRHSKARFSSARASAARLDANENLSASPTAAARYINLSAMKPPKELSRELPQRRRQTEDVRWNSPRNRDEPEETTVKRLTNNDSPSRERLKNAYRSSAVVAQGGQKHPVSQGRSSSHGSFFK